MGTAVGDVVQRGQRILEVEVGDRVNREGEGSGCRPGDPIPDLPLESDNFSGEGSGLKRGKVGGFVTGTCDPKLWGFIEDRGGNVASKAIQRSRSIIVLTVTKSGGPVDQLPPIIGSCFVVIGTAMRLAGTKHLWHNAEVWTTETIK